MARFPQSTCPIRAFDGCACPEGQCQSFAARHAHLLNAKTSEIARFDLGRFFAYVAAISALAFIIGVAAVHADEKMEQQEIAEAV